MSGKLNETANWIIAIVTIIAIVISAFGIGFFLALNSSPLFIHVPLNWHGYQARGVMSDYYRIIRYLQWWPSQLHFGELPISQHALEHFADVKLLVMKIQCATAISLLVWIAGWRYEKKNYQLWRLVILFPRMLILLSVFIAMICLSFNDSFILMHHVLFHNSYWVFSSKTDPIILLLPVRFFNHLFIVWVIIALAIIIACWHLVVRRLDQFLHPVV